MLRGSSSGAISGLPFVHPEWAKLIQPAATIGDDSCQPVFNAGYFLASHGPVDLVKVSECLSLCPNALW